MRRSVWIIATFYFCITSLSFLDAQQPKKTVQVEKKKGKAQHKKSGYKPPVRLKKVVQKGKKSHKRITPKKQPVKRQIKKAAEKMIPAKKVAKHPGTLIVIDPGHGGFDLGASANSVIEKILCLSTGLMVKKQLNDLGYRVVLTRTSDVFISLQRRIDIANSVRGKLFLSIHYNAAKNVSASGIEIYYYNAKDQYRARESKKLATAVLARMLHQTAAFSRGVKQGNFHVIRETKMPSILIEGGFITHPRDRLLVSDKKYREKLAKAIAEGVDRYCSGKQG